MRRRDLLTLATVIAWPRLARAQEPRRQIGFLSAMGWTIPGTKAAFLEALHNTGFVEGQNMDIQYRIAEGQYDRLPALAAELASRDVALIVCYDAPSAFAAK